MCRSGPWEAPSVEATHGLAKAEGVFHLLCGSGEERFMIKFVFQPLSPLSHLDASPPASVRPATPALC